MSHTTTIGIGCTMADLQDSVVSSILNDLGWRIINNPAEIGLKDNTYVGMDGKKVKIDKAILVPNDQAGKYGMNANLSKEQKKALGIEGDYKIVGMKESAPVKGQKGPGKVNIVVDDFQVKVKDRVEGAIAGGVAYRQIQNAISKLPAREGAIARQQVPKMKDQIIQAIKSQSEMSVEARWGEQAAPRQIMI